MHCNYQLNMFGFLPYLNLKWFLGKCLKLFVTSIIGSVLMPLLMDWKMFVFSLFFLNIMFQHYFGYC